MIIFDDPQAEFSESILTGLIDDAIANDSGLAVSNATFNFNEIDGKEKLKSLDIENCRVRSGLKIREILNGASINVKDCVFEDNSGLLLEHLAATNIYVLGNKLCETDTKPDFTPRFLPSESITLVQVTTDNLIINDCDFHIELEESRIGRRLKINRIGQVHDDRVVALRKCTFGSVELAIQDGKIAYFRISECSHQVDTNESIIDDEQLFVRLASSKIERLEIHDSNIERFYLDAQNVPLQNVEIIDSRLESGLNFYMSSTFSEADRLIHKIRILNSVVGASSFSGRIFDVPMRFTNTVFLEGPEFHNSTIPQGSHFPNKDHFRQRKGEDAVKAYRTLRLAMEAQRARDEEGMFYALEQESILNTRHESSKIFHISYWYQVFSDYGTNFSKPIAWLAMSFLFFSIVYAFLSSPVIGVQYTFDWSLVERSTIFSLKQTFTPFWSLRDLSPLFEKSEVNLLITFLGLLQSLASVLLITLTVLAIRWNFKRG